VCVCVCVCVRVCVCVCVFKSQVAAEFTTESEEILTFQNFLTKTHTCQIFVGQKFCLCMFCIAD